MTPSSRVVGVDYGAQRVGVAVTDPLRLFARPHGTYPPGEALRVLGEMTDATVFVVGWPILDDGSEGAAVDRIRPFLGRLKKAVSWAEVVVQDERDSSRRALADMVEAGIPKGKRRDRARLDAAAACVILQDWLDEHDESR